MAKIETKYNIADTVFRASTKTTQQQHPCPDCLDKKIWTAKSPAGAEFEIACPRCKAGYKSDLDMSLNYTAHEPAVKKLTIGSIRTDTHDEEEPVTYMCLETGVGSGFILKESELHPTEEEALKHAKIKAHKYNTETEWIAKQFDKTLSISDYQLSDAKIKTVKDRDISRRTKLSMLFDELRDCETVDEVHKTMDNFKWS